MTPPQRGQVIILRGLPGVGKSTVADALRDRLRPAVRVNEDTIRYLALPRDLTDESVGRAQNACAELARVYAASGATAIIDGVLADRTSVEAIVGRLNSSGLACRAFTLWAPLEDLLRRNAARDPLVRLPDARIRLLFTDYDHEGGEPIDTGGLVAEETADNVHQLLAAGPRPSLRPTGLILFLRHGAADVAASHYPDHAKLGLSPQGRTQVLAIRDAITRLAPTAVISSPLPRALQTAHLLDERLGLGVTTDPRLVERTFPRYYGRRYSEIAQEVGPDEAQRLLTDSDGITIDGTESLEEARDRVLAASRDWRERTEDRLLVVSHGGPHGWLLCDLLGLPDPRAARRLTLGHARLTCLRLVPTPQVLALNADADDLAGLCS